jgi:acyl-CoA thioester hydrolase
MTRTVPTAFPGIADIGVLVPVGVHFDDLDAMGMLHNSRHQVLVERAWAAYWQGQGLGGESGVEGDGFNVVKVFTITYEAPVTSPGKYAVHLWTERIGATSVTAGFRLCSSAGEVTYARGSRTLVCIDRVTFRPTSWSDRARDLALRIQAPESGG